MKKAHRSCALRINRKKRKGYATLRRFVLAALRVR
jgi:hypothetical protein